MSARRRKARARARTEGVERYRGWQRKNFREGSFAGRRHGRTPGGALRLCIEGGGYGGDSSAYAHSENLGQREVFPGPPGPP